MTLKSSISFTLERMICMSQAVFVGNLTRDPEVKVLQSGNSVANFSLAVEERFKEEKVTYFYDFEAWSWTAEKVGSLTKGQRVIVVCSPKVDTWETDDGSKRSKVVFKVFEIGVVPYVSKEEGGEKSESEAPSKKSTGRGGRRETVAAASNTEDIPF